jgi:hypothetical protein
MQLSVLQWADVVADDGETDEPASPPTVDLPGPDGCIIRTQVSIVQDAQGRKVKRIQRFKVRHWSLCFCGKSAIFSSHTLALSVDTFLCICV